MEAFLYPLLLVSFPEEMHLIVAHNLDKNEWNIDKLLCKFKLELEARERCSTIPESSPPKPPENKGGRNRGRLPLFLSKPCWRGRVPHLCHTVVIV